MDNYKNAVYRSMRPAEDQPVRASVVPPTLFFYGGLALLATLGVIDPPVAALVGLGHWLATNCKQRSLQVIGEVLEEV